MTPAITVSHRCATPFWRTADGSWTCPTCARNFRWHTFEAAVPGVPLAVCVVRHNTWVGESS